MALFGKKKIPVPPEKLQAAQEEKSQINKDMQNIDKAAKTLDELNEVLDNMCTAAFRQKVFGTAQENQRKIENFNRFYEEITNQMSANGDENGICAMKREKAVIEGTVIQYQNTRRENAYQDGENRLCFTADNAQLYQEVPVIMKNVLEDYTPSDINYYHAADILPELKPFLRQLESALESGQKLKADICKIIFSYVIQVVLKKEPAGTEEIQKELKFRKKIITEQFADIIYAVDKIYALVSDLKAYETRVSYLRKGFLKLQEEKNKISAETLESINETGFDNLMKKCTGNESVSCYQSLFHKMQNIAVWLKTTELYREFCCDKLFSLEQQLGQMLDDVMKKFDDSAENKIPEELSAKEQEIVHKINHTVSFRELEELLGTEIAVDYSEDDLDF